MCWSAERRVRLSLLIASCASAIAALVLGLNSSDPYCPSFHAKDATATTATQAAIFWSAPMFYGMVWVEASQR